MELLEKLAALVPRSRVNRVFYHGVLAPHARWRSRVVLPESPTPGLPDGPDPSGGPRLAPGVGRRHWAWAQLMERAFGIDMLACPQCGGRLRLVGTVEDPQIIRAILESLGLPAELPEPDPPPPPPAQVGGFLANAVS